MRIDNSVSVSPTPSAGFQPVARQAQSASVPEAAALVKDHVEVRQKPESSSTSVVVEMQPGNIVIYKFIDEASGRLVQQIPSEQMLNLSQSVEAAKDKKKS